MNQIAVVAPSSREQIRGHGVRTLLVILSASMVVALAARIAFPLPFTPVPFTLQPLAVLGVGLALGPRNGALAMCAYLLEGVLGLPVFSPTGPGGMAQLAGATGGFLLAYPAVAWVCGGIARRWSRSRKPFLTALLACALATVLLFTAGALWLSVEAHLQLRQTMHAAVWPFLPGETVKVLAAAGGYRAFRSSFPRQRAS